MHPFAFPQFPGEEHRGFISKEVRFPHPAHPGVILPPGSKGRGFDPVIDHPVDLGPGAQPGSFPLHHEAAAADEALHRDERPGRGPFPLAQGLIEVMHMENDRNPGTEVVG